MELSDFQKGYKLPFQLSSFKIHYKVAYAIFKPSGFSKLNQGGSGRLSSHGKIDENGNYADFF